MQLLLDYRDFKALAYSSLDDIKKWQAIKCKFHQEGCCFYVASTTGFKGNEVIAGCIALSKHVTFYGEHLLDNAYEGRVSFQCHLSL